MAAESARTGDLLQAPIDDLQGDAQNYLQNFQSKQTFMQKLSREGNLPGIGYASLPMATNNEAPTDNSTLSTCILLSNLFDPNDVNLSEDPEFYIDVRRDVLDECSSLGKVDEIYVDSNSKGNVWIKYGDNNIQSAQSAVAKFHSR